MDTALTKPDGQPTAWTEASGDKGARGSPSCSESPGRTSSTSAGRLLKLRVMDAISRRPCRRARTADNMVGASWGKGRAIGRWSGRSIRWRSAIKWVEGFEATAMCEGLRGSAARRAPPGRGEGCSMLEVMCCAALACMHSSVAGKAKMVKTPPHCIVCGISAPAHPPAAYSWHAQTL